MYTLGQILVENKTQHVIAELIRAHFAAHGVGNVPKLGLQRFLVSSDIEYGIA